MSTSTSLPGGGGAGSNVAVTNVVGVTFPPSQSSGTNPVGITGLVGITGPIGITGQLGVTVGNFPAIFGVTGFVGATIGNFPALFGITGPIGVSVSNSGFGASISNTGLGVTFPVLSVTFPIGFGVGASVSNTGLGVTFPVLSVTFPIGFGVTFNPGVTFAQQSAIGITGAAGFTGIVMSSLGYTLGKTNVFKSLQAQTGASAAIFLATFMAAAGTNFYLMGYYFDGSYTSATAGVGWLGNVWLQSALAGSVSTLAIHRVINPGGGFAQVFMEFIEPPFFGNSVIIQIGVTPSQTNLITWTGNFWGYQK